MKIYNKRAKFDYQLLESLEAGIALTGAEVKSLKQGRGDLSSAFVRIKDGEAWLVGVNIPAYSSGPREYDPLRLRKLLLHKDQILSLDTKTKQQKLTLVPILLYTKGNLVKLKIALAKGKKRFEKKEEKKKKDLEREIERALKG